MLDKFTAMSTAHHFVAEVLMRPERTCTRSLFGPWGANQVRNAVCCRRVGYMAYDTSPFYSHGREPLATTNTVHCAA